MRDLIFLICLSFFVRLPAQSGEIKGRITDESGTAIPGVSIRIAGSKIGTTSGPKGFFVLATHADAFILEISAIGFTTLTISVDDLSQLPAVFEMRESILSLPELVLETNSITSGRQGLKDIPGSVNYIDAKQLARQNYTNVNEILRQVPGINLQEEDGFGLRPNIGLRGSGLERSSKITIMEDGILAAPAPYSAPSAYYFPTAGRMSGVEVLKGSSQVRFGPFTTGGAINFLSTPIPDRLGGKAEFIVGSFGIRNMHAHFGDRTERFGYLIEAFQYGAEGFKTVPGGETGFLKNDLNTKFSFNSEPTKRVFRRLDVNIGWTNEDSDETYLGLTQTDFDVDPFRRYAASQEDKMLATQTRKSIQHYLEIPGLFNLVTTAYRNDFQRNWYKLQSVAGQSLSSVLDDPTNQQTGYDLLTGQIDDEAGSLVVRANNRAYYSQGIQNTVEVDFETGRANHEIQVSVRIHRDSEDRFQHEDRYGMTDQQMNLVLAGAPGSHANRIEQASSTASYLFYKLEIGRFGFTPGIRNERVTISRRDFGKNDSERSITSDYSERSNFFSAWLPGVGVNYKLSEKSRIFAGIHEGFAPGSSKEGSRPESSINYELGARTSSERFSGSLTLFTNDYQNLLGADNASSGGAGSGELFNAGQALTQGIEAELTIDLSPVSSQFSLPATVAYTFTDARFKNTFDSEFDGWGSVTTGDQIPYLARNQLFVGLDYRTQRLGASLTGKYQSDVLTRPGSDLSADLIEGFFTTDFSLNYFINKMTLFGSVTNLTNEKYAVSQRPAGLRPGMPRAFRVGISVDL